MNFEDIANNNIGRIVAFVLTIFAAVMILISETYPESVYNFLRGWVRWQARVLAYMAGLVDEYPPFSLDMSTDTPLLTTGAGA